MKVVSLCNFSRIALSYVKQTFNVQLYQEIVTRMTEAWLVINISECTDILYIYNLNSYFLQLLHVGTHKKVIQIFFFFSIWL